MNKMKSINLLQEFNEWLNLSFSCPEDLMAEAEQVFTYSGGKGLKGQNERNAELIALVNSKLNLNKWPIRKFIDSLAKHSIYFNYHEKLTLQRFFDKNLRSNFEDWASRKGINSSNLSLFRPITKQETIAGLHDLLNSGKVNRSDARDCPIEEKRTLIQKALFGCYVFRVFDEKLIYGYINEDARRKYIPKYFEHLRSYHRELLHRECALIHFDVDLGKLWDGLYSTLSEKVLSWVKQAYNRLANHCYLSIRLHDSGGWSETKWRLFSDIILFAEKHKEIILRKGYFHPDKIIEHTISHIPEINLDEACFEVANEGFFFKDCYILSSARAEETNSAPYDLLILLEKNDRDERVLPCPACRSKNVIGNSYPTLGVRSWECKNPICPERSAYDRGNRYSLSSIIRQEAISSEQDQIPLEIRRRWRNDVLFDAREEDVINMLVRLFSLNKDSLIFVNGKQENKDYLGRKLKFESYEDWPVEPGIRKRFYESAFFKRFAIVRQQVNIKFSPKFEKMEKTITLIHGDCETALRKVKESSISGAVTSPPYYNAREYSQWPNIYCYLYDMYNAARSVSRVLKPGAPYIFNIFDYFDNEKTVAFSAMGKKRMILGAYIIYLFEKCDFRIIDNTIWFKGDIEGKRNFNQGNTSPYYQLPFNCWEHCLVFQKMGSPKPLPQQVQILKQKPVFKMVNGKNIHGHTAPFPPQIPMLLLNKLQPGETVLDPYSGSMTTVCIAAKHGFGAIAVEQDDKYFELGKAKVKNTLNAPKNLFSDSTDSLVIV